MKKRIGIIIICTMLICSIITYSIYNNPWASIEEVGNTYYVSTTGNDANLGTQSSPWRHIQYAVNHVNPGDTILVRGGKYNEIVTITKSGTSGNPITLKNYFGETPIVDGTGGKVNTFYGVIQGSGLSYIIIDGFRINNAASNGIRFGSSNHITVQNCYIYYCGFSSIRTDYCSYVYIYGNTASSTNHEEAQEAISICQTHDFELKYNTILGDCIKEGLCCKDNVYNGIIAYNEIDTPKVNLYIGNGIYDGDTHDFQIYSNYCHGSSVGCAIGAELGGGSVTNFWFYNNIFANPIYPYRNTDVQSSGSCFTDNIHFINNVFHSKGGRPCLVLDPNAYSNRYTNTVIRNNIFYGGIGITINSNQPTSELTVDHNFFADGSDLLGTDYITGDPKWVDPSAGDYHLQSISPAIDAGSNIDAPSVDFDGNTRPQGIKVDLGAYEYITNGNNNPPIKPTINGEIKGKIDTEYEYKFVSTDPEGDNIKYYINWGDDATEIIIGPYSSGTEASATHIWTEKGNYIIKVKAKDIYSAESGWSTLEVRMPKILLYDSIIQLLQNIIQRYPFLEKILNQYYYY